MTPRRALSNGQTPGDLRDHGDTQVPAGCVDLAVNIEPGPPGWLACEFAELARGLDAYPDDGAAREAAARRHGRSVAECAVVAGAAEAFWLLPFASGARLAACVHPGFTEPEVALRAAGVPVVRVFRDQGDGWRLDPRRIPDHADVVVVGRPENPTGAIDDVRVIEQLCRDGRLVIVDEAFAEFFEDASGLAGRHDLPGLVCVRSLTKLWGLAGLRIGYLLGPEWLASRVDTLRQPWSVSTLALHALERLVTAEPERQQRARHVADRRARFVRELEAIDGVTAWGAANYVLIRTPHADLRAALLVQGLAARRADTFPGLDTRYVRIAVRDDAIQQRVIDAVRDALGA
ncbi:MAG: aminotransferase class I/II-fold pyridoxal phosphate-dependent enzyme [Nitriliruptoraceae bacterium]